MPVIVGLVVMMLTSFILSGPTLCKDGWASKSIGRQGACSHHGGVGGSKNGGIGFLLGIIFGIGAGYITWQVQLSNANSRSNAPSQQNKPNQQPNNLLVGDRAPNKRNQQHPSSSSREPPPSCPRCGSRMVRRTARRGRNAGNDFFGCSRYPNCTKTKSITS